MTPPEPPKTFHAEHIEPINVATTVPTEIPQAAIAPVGVQPLPERRIDARIEKVLRSVMVDPKSCAYCEGTGWVFNDKSYNGYPYGRGPYVEPDDTNGGYHACSRCNGDYEVEFGSGETIKPWRRWDDDEVAEIADAVAGEAGIAESLALALGALCDALPVNNDGPPWFWSTSGGLPSEALRTATDSARRVLAEYEARWEPR